MNDENKDASQKLYVLAQALADPLRLSILQHLMSGSATVSELVSLTSESQSKVSNHLALLRERELVRATRQGRQMIYELKEPSVSQLVEALTLVAGAIPAHIWKSPALVKARTCYDHLAGQLGVNVLEGLVARGALEEAEQNNLTLGPQASGVFAELAIEPKNVAREKRKFAYNCLDWTERRPHLGGALGAAVWARLMERGWVVRQPGTRALLLTESGRQGIENWLGRPLELEADPKGAANND